MRDNVLNIDGILAMEENGTLPGGITGMAVTKEQNEQLTQTNAGTLMGDLLRRYWIPALLSEEVAERDRSPGRVQLLGEPLVAFRGSEGRRGVIGELLSRR